MPIPSLCGIWHRFVPVAEAHPRIRGPSTRTAEPSALLRAARLKAAVAPDGLGGRLRFVMAASELCHDLVQRQAALAQQHHQMEDQIARLVAKLVIVFDFSLQ